MRIQYETRKHDDLLISYDGKMLHIDTPLYTPNTNIEFVNARTGNVSKTVLNELWAAALELQQGRNLSVTSKAVLRQQAQNYDRQLRTALGLPVTKIVTSTTIQHVD